MNYKLYAMLLFCVRYKYEININNDQNKREILLNVKASASEVVLQYLILMPGTQ